MAFGSVGGADAETEPLTGAEEFAIALPMLIALGGGALIAAGLDGSSPRRVLGLVGVDRVSVPLGALVGLVLQAVVVGLELWVIEPLFGEEPDGGAQELVDAFSGTTEIVLLVVLVVGLAPVAEEFFYRGVVLPLVLRRWGPLWSVVIVSVLFALAHLQGRQLLGLLVVGMGLGALRVWRGTVAAPIAAHVAFNSAGLLAIAFDTGV
ncbi:MAG: CPBP family intramembrane metalloprotease [Actinomycetota bacterium]|nr:CPBP family intramembrane metalloprotease [Actinomycetota bacterium]